MPFGNAVGEGFVNGSVIVATKVIVFGSGEGVFIYSGTPGLGNPPILSLTGGTVDPYGNTVQPTFESRNSAGDYTVINDGIITMASPSDFLPASIAAGGGEMVIEGGEASSGDTPASLSLLSADANGGTSEAEITAQETIVTGSLTVQGSLILVVPISVTGTSATAGLPNGTIAGTSGAASAGTAHTHGGGSYSVTNGVHSHGAGSYEVS
jgi:hypothetical protein